MTVGDLPNLGEKCTGCAACANACPVAAICMKEDGEGFLYPAINGKCVGCGKCVSVCSIEKSHATREPVAAWEAFAADDTVRGGGSSGGVFGLLARSVLKRGGVVYGAIYDAALQGIRHASTRETTLDQICRSKYAQSTIGDAYKGAKEDLIKGLPVLFCGTPCQTEALMNYLGADHLNLLLVDFVCHGVPPPGFFRDYIQYRQREIEKKVVGCTFREKDMGWRKQVMKLYLEDGTTYREISLLNFYYWLFLYCYSLRRSCFACERHGTRISDITLADAWDTTTGLDDGKGLSFMVANTSKGVDATRGIKDQMTIKERTVALCDLKRYEHSKKQYKRRRRERLFSFIQEHGIEKTERVFFPRARRVVHAEMAARSTYGRARHIAIKIAKKVLRRA